MLNRRRRLSVAVLASIVLAAAAVPLAAQEPEAVGPPELKDFRLPGQRTTPPAQQPVPQPAPPPTRQPAATRPPPADAAPSGTAAQPGRREARRPAPVADPVRTPAAAAPQQAPPPAADAQPPVTTLPAAPLPVPGPPLVAPVPAPAPAAEAGATWPWLLGVLLLGLLGWFGFRRFDAMRAEARRRALRESRAAARAAAPAPVPAVEPEPVPAETGPRARLELGFKPERAVATDTETIVHYDLVLHNVGEEIARNIRIDARMFNASAEDSIGAFLAGPMHDQSGSPQVTILPGEDLELASAIAMTKDEVRGINVAGRSIFVPIVAINVAYDWDRGEAGIGAGRTSRSWLVGREPETPSAKMGAFSLDVGPRIYRSVGQRPTELANVA